MTVNRTILQCVLLLAGLALAAGCEQRIVGTSYGNFGDKQSDQLADNQGGFFGFGGKQQTTSSSTAGDQWTIGLGRFEGSAHRQRADRARQQLAARTGFDDLWTAEENGGTMLYAGHYPSPQDKQAKADLQKWRQLRSSGQVRLPAAMMVPIVDTPEGEIGDLDLRNAAARGQYTLQVGFYDNVEAEGKDHRKAAEKAAAALRDEGHLAFYYHGPNRSMVTVGIFGPDAVVSQNGETAYAAEVTKLQREFPYNLANGQTIRETRGDKTTEQPSFLVRIPGGK